jgi:hypothetical protein
MKRLTHLDVTTVERVHVGVLLQGNGTSVPAGVLVLLTGIVAGLGSTYLLIRYYESKSRSGFELPVLVQVLGLILLAIAGFVLSYIMLTTYSFTVPILFLQGFGHGITLGVSYGVTKLYLHS